MTNINSFHLFIVYLNNSGSGRSTRSMRTSRSSSGGRRSHARKSASMLRSMDDNSLSDEEDAVNFEWVKKGGVTGISAAGTTPSTLKKSKVPPSSRGIPPRVNTAPSGAQNKRASAALLIEQHRQTMAERDKQMSIRKLKDTSEKIQTHSVPILSPPTTLKPKVEDVVAEAMAGVSSDNPQESQQTAGTSDLASTISNFHANLVRPSQFSTQSSSVARQFLQEDEHHNNSGGGNLGEIATSSGAESTSLLERHQQQHMSGSNMHDMSEYSEAMSQQDSQRGTYLNNSQTSVSDLEWNPEAQRQQQEEWRSRARDVLSNADTVANRSNLAVHRQSPTPDGHAKAASSSLFAQRKDLREVDQTVNLMDASMGDYDNLMNSAAGGTGARQGSFYSQSSSGSASKSTKKPATGFFGQMNSSLVDIWLDERSTDTGSMTSKQRMRRRRVKGTRSQSGRDSSCCRDLFCSWLTVVFVVAGLIGAFIAWRTGAFMKSVPVVDTGSGDDAESAASEAAAAAATAEELKLPPVPDTGLKDDFHKFLVEHKISSSEALERDNSPQFLAWHWLSTLADPIKLLMPSAAKKEGQAIAGDDSYLNEAKLEAYALAVMYFETNADISYDVSDDFSTKTNWKTNTNWMQPAPVCSWYGIQCEDERIVIEVNLTHNELKGRLPQELKVFSSLRMLDLVKNEITGQLPETLFEMLPQMEYLWLQENQVCHGA